MIRMLAEIVQQEDPSRRFIPSSPSGPSFSAERKRFGEGVHWDVHGPWHLNGDLETEWLGYWRDNDALFHSEVGVAGASSVEIIRAFKGDLEETPGTLSNPLWRRSSWWIDWPAFVEQLGREPANLEEFVSWSHSRQARALENAARETKQRFPRCGGIIIWMGHDCFPCTANTSIIDFNGNRKPAAEAVAAVFRGDVSRSNTEYV
jgi:beta-mannosidase